MSPAIRCWLAASWSTLCRTVAKSVDIALSCCSGGELADGTNQPSCGDKFAIISLAALPYDCQAKVAVTPIQNMIRKRARPREARFTSDARLLRGSAG